jgi:HK97 gp10 family phage protein
MSQGLTIKGEKRFKRKMENLPKVVRKKLKKMLNDTGNAVVKEAKASIKRNSGNWEQYGDHWSSPPGTPPNNDTGELADSIHKDESAKIGSLSISVVADAPYANALEFGTKFIEPRPFMGPAFRMYSPLLTKAGKQLLRDIPKGLAKDG